MRKITLFICVSLFTILSCNSKSEEAKPPADSTTKMLPAETKPETPVAAMPDQAAMDSIWKIFKTPGDMHKWMEKTNAGSMPVISILTGIQNIFPLYILV